MPERKGPQRIPPSRARYLEKMPTVSARISADTKMRLNTLRMTTGTTLAEIIQRAVDGQMPQMLEIQQRGYQKGIHDAKELFRVLYPCSRCGGAIAIMGPAVQQAVAKVLRDAGWGHKECPRK